MRKEVIGNCELYLGDCLQVLPEIGNIDHCITDPPYEAEAHNKGRRLRGKQKNNKRTVEMSALEFEPITDELRKISSELIVQINWGWFLAFCQAEAVFNWRKAMEAAGAIWKRSAIWVKPDGTPQFTGDRPGMGYESIAISWCGEGRSKWNGGGKHGVFTYPNREDNFPKLHQTQKPISLMQELLHLFTNREETVLDPFMGSGTTGVACAKMGRKFMGIEIEPKYFDIACKRIDEAYKQPDMFIEPVKPMKQDAMQL